MANLSANHRTAVFVRTDNPSPAYQERVKRLVQSFNGQNIKADLYSVDAQGNITKGVNFDSVPFSSGTDESLIQAATDAGYVQAVVVHPTVADKSAKSSSRW